MTTKSRYVCFFALVAVLLGSACKLSVSIETSEVLSSSHHAEFTGFHRHLRASEAKQNDDYEERAIVNLSKVKELSSKRLKNLKQLVETAKTKLNMHKADLRFAKLVKVKSNVFGSSQFEKWAASVTKTHKNNPDAADVAMVTALASHYGDDGLAAMLTTAKQVAGTESTAIRLENAQLNIWLAEGRNADDVFNLLKIDDAGGNLLKKPQLSTWFLYTNKLNKDPYDLLLIKLRRHYGDSGVASMLVRAKNDPVTRTIANKLETLQLETWLKEKKNMVDVFKFLKLNEEGSAVLKSPVLGTWMAYAGMLNKDPDELLFLALKQTGFDDAAAEIEKLVLARWRLAGKSGDDIFKLIGLNKAGDRVFDSPLWSTWVTYLNKRNDADEVMFTVLRAQYGDERLTKLVAKASEITSTKEIVANLQLDVWRMNGLTSDEVFNVLKLNRMGDKIFESPELSTWVAYVRKLSSYTRSNEFSAITQLEQRFGTAKLARMFAKSKESAKTAATKKLLANLQKSQFKRWFVGKKTPVDVKDMLVKSSKLSKEDNAKVIRDYQVYFTA